MGTQKTAEETSAARRWFTILALALISVILLVVGYLFEGGAYALMSLPFPATAAVTALIGAQIFDGKSRRESTLHTFEDYKEWRIGDLLHREDGPALEYADGTREWHQNGQLHRTDGPAVEDSDGLRAWYQDGLLHRESGPAMQYADGYSAWYTKGLLHRTDGPAIVDANGGCAWFKNGERHRLDGPAIEKIDGCDEWYVDGKQLSEAEFKAHPDTRPKARHVAD